MDVRAFQVASVGHSFEGSRRNRTKRFPHGTCAKTEQSTNGIAIVQGNIDSDSAALRITADDDFPWISKFLNLLAHKVCNPPERLSPLVKVDLVIVALPHVIIRCKVAVMKMVSLATSL